MQFFSTIFCTIIFTKLLREIREFRETREIRENEAFNVHNAIMHFKKYLKGRTKQKYFFKINTLKVSQTV